MNYETHNTNKSLEADGTWLQGYVDADYADLVTHFGKPTKADGYKVDAEWIVKDKDTGVLATVYNYKDGKNYLGRDGVPTKQIRAWHIGGTDKRAVDLILSILGKPL